MTTNDRPAAEVIAEVDELRRRLVTWQREAGDELRRRDELAARLELLLASREQELAAALVTAQAAREAEAEATEQLEALRASTTYRFARGLARTADRVKSLRR